MEKRCLMKMIASILSDGSSLMDRPAALSIQITSRDDLSARPFRIDGETGVVVLNEHFHPQQPFNAKAVDS